MHISGMNEGSEKKMEHFRNLSVSKKQSGCIGVMVGAVLAAFLIQPLRLLPPGGLNVLAASGIYLLLMLGGWLAGCRWNDKRDFDADSRHVPMGRVCDKILDTSVIIDGRILDICKAGFLEGEIVIPAFVLDELRHIADSADPLRRNRGRRGLDVLNKLQNEIGCPVRIVEQDYNDVEEVDVKLLRLCREQGGAVLTNDYNLNKVAGVTGVQVLNINELAGALRPVVLPGEEMHVHLVREGKEPGQGVAYLEDGTMVVVENGRRRVGETLDVVVTTVLQTNAGRMIFSRVKAGEDCAV